MIQAAVPLSKVSVKLPSFWTNSLEVWFLQAEAQFEVKRITASRTIDTHCVVALPQDVACRLLNLVFAPHGQNVDPPREARILLQRLVYGPSPSWYLSTFEQWVYQWPHGMALRADELWLVCGSIPVQVLPEQFENMYALPCRNSSTRSGPRSQVPRSASHSSVGLFLLEFVCITADGEITLTSVKLTVPIQKSS